MIRKNAFLSTVVCAIWMVSLSCQTQQIKDAPGWHDEVVYHMFQRSFFDSDGDRHGDLNGVIEKLDYLTGLGVTAILFTPLYESDFYHNYFPVDYQSIDPEYGHLEDYDRFIRAVHSKGLKFIMDMETQYVQNGNRWLESSYKNPGSEYSGFIYYKDTLNEITGSIFGGIEKGFPSLPAWPDQQLRIAMLDLNHDTVRSWMQEFYAHWVDPNGDGRFDDGVDGFRIDHIMDDLDYLGIFEDLYVEFWQPIFERCRSVNPDIFIIGEQSNWGSFGEEMLEGSTADACFGFPIRFAISGTPTSYLGTGGQETGRNEMDVSNMHRAVVHTMQKIPEDKNHILFIENHDMDRWASAMEGHTGKIRCAAVLNLTLPGIPALYYGQELGVTGMVGNWGHDGNHIPVREAFPWFADPGASGMTVWYKNSGPWWDGSYYQSEAVQDFAFSAQKDKPGSLWNLYRQLIENRKKYVEFQKGRYQPLMTSDSVVFAFARELESERSVVIMNLSETTRIIDPGPLDAFTYDALLSEGASREEAAISLGPFAFIILKK